MWKSCRDSNVLFKKECYFSTQLATPTVSYRSWCFGKNLCFGKFLDIFMQSKSSFSNQTKLFLPLYGTRALLEYENTLWEMSKASGIILLGNKYVHSILHWPRCHYNIERLPLRVQLEEPRCRAMPLMTLACALSSKSSFNLNHSPAVSQILWIWRQFKHHNRIQAISILPPSVSSVSEW